MNYFDPQLELMSLGEISGIPEVGAFLAAQKDLKTGRVNYSAERLKKHHPVIYGVAVALLKEGASIRFIKRVLGIHHYTIEAIQEAEQIQIGDAKERLGRKCMAQAGLCFDTAVEVIEDKDPRELAVKDARDLVVMGGILNQHGQLLQGNATSRVEHDGLPSLQKLKDQLDSDEPFDIEAEEMDSAAGAREPKRALPSGNDAKRLPDPDAGAWIDDGSTTDRRRIDEPGRRPVPVENRGSSDGKSRAGKGDLAHE
jgi:hypothetical protein